MSEIVHQPAQHPVQHPVQRQEQPPVPRQAPAPHALHEVRLQPTRTLANAAILAAGAFTAASLGATLTAFLAQSTLEDVLAGAPAPAFLPYDVFSIIYSALGLVAFVATAIWLSRSRANALLIRPQFPHERGRVWTWLGWFVPVVSLWFPRQVVRDVHRGSSPTLAPPPGLDAWWGLWLGGLFFNQMSDRIALSGELELVSWLGPLNAVSTLLMVGAFVCWVRIVTAVVRLQEAAAADAS